MTKTESHCVQCDLPCIYEACPNYSVEVHYCDSKGCHEYAAYENNGTETCDDCTEKILEDIFSKLSFEEKVKLFNWENENVSPDDVETEFQYMSVSDKIELLDLQDDFTKIE